jgi:hypothetical protein
VVGVVVPEVRRRRDPAPLALRVAPHVAEQRLPRREQLAALSARWRVPRGRGPYPGKRGGGGGGGGAVWPRPPRLQRLCGESAGRSGRRQRERQGQRRVVVRRRRRWRGRPRR